MHERALMADVVRQVTSVAVAEGAARVTRVDVRFGPLSHFTPEHFAGHFVDASQGTVAEGATVVAVLDGDITGDRARDVIVESVEVEL